MTDDLMKRLRAIAVHSYLGRSVIEEAADRIEALTTQLAEDRDARVLMDDRLEQLVSQVDALTSGAAKMLAEQDCDYNRKTNDLIKRHAEQVKALTAERDRLREALEYILAECTLSDNTMPSVGAIKYAARAALKGESHE